jgi:hypothetical protein
MACHVEPLSIFLSIFTVTRCLCTFHYVKRIMAFALKRGEPGLAGRGGSLLVLAHSRVGQELSWVRKLVCYFEYAENT